MTTILRPSSPSSSSRSVVVLLAFVATVALSLVHERQKNLPSMIFGRPPGGFIKNAYHLYMNKDSRADADTDFPNVSTNWFIQKMDHFDPVGTGTWKQKYYYNSAKVNLQKSNGQDVVFLMIGGEGRESPKWVGDDNVSLVKYATQYGAHLFDLEHRFFGDSKPINDMKSSSLKLLTTEQALADLAYFITSMNQKYHFKDPKWVTFGGSYPGALSAQFRSKYPEWTVGAVASSAPLKLKLDFYEYATVVDLVLDATPLADNKTNCKTLATQAFTKLQQLSLTEDGRNQLNTMFRLSPPFDSSTSKADITNFFSNIYNIFQGMTQYTYDGRSNTTKYVLTAAKMCEMLSLNKNGVVDPAANIWDLITWYNSAYSNAPTTSFDNSYRDNIVPLQKTDYANMTDDEVEYRGWTWLCCNEIGYMQTTDTNDIAFGSILPINYFYDMCTDLYGDNFKATWVRDGNSVAAKYYGGDGTFDATNLMLPNGGFDPWHSLGYFNEDPVRNIQIAKVDHGAHCVDMYPAYDGEPADLPAARQKIMDFLGGILNLNGTTTTSSSTPTPPVQPTTGGSSAVSFVFAALLALLPFF